MVNGDPIMARRVYKAAMRGVIVALVLAASATATAPAPPREGAFFDSNHVQIHYVDKGQGAPVVLVHGFTGSFERHWQAPGVAQALESAGYRVIGIDCRGHGESGKPRDPRQYGLEMVRDVVRLLDHLHVDRAHVVGVSMGGWIASQLLVGYPDRIRTVTLVGAGWEGEDLKELSSQMLALADGFDRKDASALIRGVTSGQNPPSDQEVAAMSASLFARNEPAVLAAIARALVPLADIPAERLRAATAPVLAIVGEHDAHNREAVKRMNRVLPALEVVEIPGATHATTPRPSAPFIVAFLDKHRRD